MIIPVLFLTLILTVITLNLTLNLAIITVTLILLMHGSAKLGLPLTIPYYLSAVA